MLFFDKWVDVINQWRIMLSMVITYVSHHPFKNHFNLSDQPTCDKIKLFIPGGCAAVAYQHAMIGHLIANSVHFNFIRDSDRIVFEGYSSGSLCAVAVETLLNSKKNITSKEFLTKLKLANDTVFAEFYNNATFKMKRSQPIAEVVHDIVWKNVDETTRLDRIKVYATRKNSICRGGVENVEFGSFKTIDCLKDAITGSIHIPGVISDTKYHKHKKGHCLIDGFVGDVLYEVARMSNPNRIIFLNDTAVNEMGNLIPTAKYIEGSYFKHIELDNVNQFSKLRGYLFTSNKEVDSLFEYGKIDAANNQAKFDKIFEELLNGNKVTGTTN